MNSIVDNGNVNYKRLGVVYTILVLITSISLAFIVVIWVLAIIPEQVSRLENLPVLGFGFLNLLFTLIYLTLNQDYRERIIPTP